MWLSTSRKKSDDAIVGFWRTKVYMFIKIIIDRIKEDTSTVVELMLIE